MPAARLLALFLLVASPAAHALTLANARWQVDIDPATLAVTATTRDGVDTVISSATARDTILDLVQTPVSAQWQRGGATTIHATLEQDALQLRFERSSAGVVTWPTLPTGAGALLLPLHEGYYIPAGDTAWRDELLSAYGEVNTTEDLTLPVIGLAWPDRVLSILFATPFNNTVRFSADGASLALTAEHDFHPLNQTDPYVVIVNLDAPDWLAPAKRYRQWLQAQGGFIALKDKLARVPDGDKLIGASHLYLWGDRVLAEQDVRDWRQLKALLPHAWVGKDKEAREAVTAPHSGPYVQQVLVSTINAALAEQFPGETADAIQQRRHTLDATLGKALQPEAARGDTASPRMIHALQAAGLPRLWLGLPDWTAAWASPGAVDTAIQAGYLVAPYDSYDTALPDGNDTPSWLSAQLGQDAFERCGIMKPDGQRIKGFQGNGVYTNAACVRPLMERRVRALRVDTPYNSWFLDVAATGMLFDDSDPAKPTSQAQDAANRSAALAWLADSEKLVVGSEVGAATVNRHVAFAHGAQTAGFGWGDPQMRRERASPYYLGAWAPEHQPAFFFRQSQLKPRYQQLYFNPSRRLPLLQAAFHDSVVSTHHWTLDSLKFRESRSTTELLQQLYNVPPLLNLSVATAASRIAYLRHLDAFFRPLHQALFDQALVDFRWRDTAGQVQQTTFADGSVIVANFSNQPQQVDAHTLRPHSATARLADGRTFNFTSPTLP
ncbi:glycosyl hydrolase family 101 [Stenotrophomonas rhizophila]|uniref:Glycosyl hydrolase family 101 n=1 Tax=Stenotrophomonas rhizophila TaxID=216778 RepID=A0A498CFV8_9GAMM|nr:glycoside hydrolase [Stenotrophomonas rhizophila]RLK55873.1 glycosyl hydrolase family 101 [Stenotrophomonas rhizophila]